VAGNKRKLSRKEFNGWSEYFNYEFDQHSKIELYLARLINLMEIFVGGQSDMAGCYIPPLSREMVEKAEAEYRQNEMISADEMAAMLKGAYNGE
jgi:hypothetical protein